MDGAASILCLLRYTLALSFPTLSSSPRSAPSSAGGKAMLSYLADGTKGEKGALTRRETRESYAAMLYREGEGGTTRERIKRGRKREGGERKRKKRENGDLCLRSLLILLLLPFDERVDSRGPCNDSRVSSSEEAGNRARRDSQASSSLHPERSSSTVCTNSNN